VQTRYKILVFIACLIPFALLVFDIFTDSLSANPVEDITHRTGEWALHFLIVTLSITPLRGITGWQNIQHVRRMLGLYSFFYAVLHLSIYLLDQSFSFDEILTDILKRPYITIGFSALLMMLPLALTSNRFSMRKLGPRWKRLHSLVYVIAVAAVLHFLWLVKADTLEPVIYAIVIVLLLAWRALRQRHMNRLNS